MIVVKKLSSKYTLGKRKAVSASKGQSSQLG